MEFIKINLKHFEDLKKLQSKYKLEIGKEKPTDFDFAKLGEAIKEDIIHFYGCMDGERLVGLASVSYVFSTYKYEKIGILEDFYILEDYRHKGLARKLIDFIYKESGLNNISVTCADCDIKMYNSLGLDIRLGTMFVRDNA